MSRKFGAFNTRKRAHPLAWLLVTTSLYPLAVQAEPAKKTIALPAVEVAADDRGADRGKSKEGELNKTPESLYQTPLGQVETTIPADRMINTQAFTVFDVLRDSPGVEVKQGNGPRDVGISIRGSNARNPFGIRNIVVFEDGFPVTQPDGLSRTDLTDPHAYGAIDVIRGPSSALYGNYATGGAINFRMRTGAQINGVDVGTDTGSFGYLNNYFRYGAAGKDYDVSVFSSNVIGNGPTNHNLFNTQTVNVLASYSPTPDDKFTVKMIGNRLYGDLSVRLNLNQFYLNPFQNNCYAFPNITAARAAGCGTVNILRNGFFGPRDPLTAHQAGLHRDDTRMILGLRWEHNLDNNNIWRTQVVLDDKNIYQPTSAFASKGDQPSINVMSDVTGFGKLFGFDTAHFGGIYFNTVSGTNIAFNPVPPNGRSGGTTQITPSQQTNAGLHGREEIRFSDYVTGVVGLGAEYTNINGTLNNFTYRGTFNPTVTGVSVNNHYYNIAPEGALVYRPNSEWLVKARVGTGYGTPQASNLFVTQTGAPGNNTGLKSQTNLGLDLAAIWTPLDTVWLSVDGFYEWFRNEFVTQFAPVTAAVPAPQGFTFNAPRSEHRGVEVAGLWQPYPGWKARIAYTYNNQIYTQYSETLTGVAQPFDRAGNWIPGIALNQLTARLGYDVPWGPLKGLGGFAEYYLTDHFYADNANLLRIPGYRVVNLNIHYDTDVQNSFIQKVGAFFEVRNVFNNTYVASANNITNTVTGGVQDPGFVLAGFDPARASGLANSGTIFAGFPRVFIGGLRVKF
ncbi:MAG: TonB-dependent receptor family protein [Methylocella sp.]